ncbi:MAG: endonuclease domain-containing protein [Bacteroidota bacterium]
MDRVSPFGGGLRGRIIHNLAFNSYLQYMLTNNHYNTNLKHFASELRTESSSRAERHLWKSIKAKKLGVGFKRQRPILNFIVDFFAQEIGLIIEIDGSSHLTKGEYDRYRQEKLEKAGYSILRFSEGDVFRSTSQVLMQIEHAIISLTGETR